MQIWSLALPKSGSKADFFEIFILHHSPLTHKIITFDLKAPELVEAAPLKS